MFQLQNMRSHKALKWPIRILFAVVIVSFVFFYGWQQGQKKTSRAQSLAKVRSENWQPWAKWIYIGSDQLKAAQERAFSFKMQLLPPYIAQLLQRENISPSRLVAPEEAAREAANGLLLARKARQTGIVVSRDEIRQMFNGQPGMTNERFREMARREGYVDPMDFVDRIASDYAQDRLRSIESTLAQASLFELWQDYTLAKEKITLQLAAYPVEQFKDLVVVSDDDLAAYLEDHREQFRVPDQRRYQYAAFKKNDLRQGINPTDEDLKVFYEQNQQDYRQSEALKADEIFVPLMGEDTPTTVAQAALEAIMDEAAVTEDWEALQDKLIAANPDFRFIHRPTDWLELDNQQRPAVYMDALVALDDGEVATVSDDSAVYLIRKSAERPERVKPFEEVSVQVSGDFANERLDTLFAEKFKQLDEEASRHNSVRSFAQAVGLDDKLTTMVARTEMNIPEMGNFSRERDYLKMLNKNQLSPLIKQPNQLLVLEIIEEKNAHDPELAAIRSAVETAVRSERSVALTEQAAGDTLSLIKGGAAFEEAMANAPTPPVTTEPFVRTQRVQALGAPLIDFARQTLAIEVGSTGVSPYGMGESNITGYAVWKVTAIDSPSKEEFAEERVQFTRDFLMVQRLSLLNEWMEDLRREGQFAMVDHE